MVSVIQKLAKKKLIEPPKWLPDNVVYETMMGSVAYGVSGNSSDIDVYGFCMPPKDMIFPHLRGEILGFGAQQNRFNQFDPHHVVDPDSGKEYDFAMYSIVKYFDLCMGCNPNMIDSLFTPRRCVITSTAISEVVRENRKMFLHKRAWSTFKGYAYAQMAKLDKNTSSNPRRAKDIEQYGMDTKFAYHIVRLMCEIEQILMEGDLDLERNSEQLKAVRRGEWTIGYLKQWAQDKEASLDELNRTSSLQHSPDVNSIRELLMQCIESHYGTISQAIARVGTTEALMGDIQAVLDRYQ